MVHKLNASKPFKTVFFFFLLFLLLLKFSGCVTPIFSPEILKSTDSVTCQYSVERVFWNILQYLCESFCHRVYAKCFFVTLAEQILHRTLVNTCFCINFFLMLWRIIFFFFLAWSFLSCSLLFFHIFFLNTLGWLKSNYIINWETMHLKIAEKVSIMFYVFCYFLNLFNRWFKDYTLILLVCLIYEFLGDNKKVC